MTGPPYSGTKSAEHQAWGEASQALIDLDRWLMERGLTPATESLLHGFRADVGVGHLNQQGHRVWAEFYQWIIPQVLSQP